MSSETGRRTCLQSYLIAERVQLDKSLFLHFLQAQPKTVWFKERLTAEEICGMKAIAGLGASAITFKIRSITFTAPVNDTDKVSMSF